MYKKDRIYFISFDSPIGRTLAYERDILGSILGKRDLFLSKIERERANVCVLREFFISLFFARTHSVYYTRKYTTKQRLWLRGRFDYKNDNNEDHN